MQNQNIIKLLSEKLFSLITLTSILSGAVFSVEAQTVRRTAKKLKLTAVELEKKACAGCWSGKVTYSKKYEEKFASDEPVFGTLNPKDERVTHNDTRNYEYAGKMIVDGSGGTPRADIEINYDERETETASVTEFTRCHNFENDRLVTESNETKKTTGGEAAAASEPFDVYVYGEDFRFGIRLPNAKGKSAWKNTITRKNFCSNSTRKPSETTEGSNDDINITGESVSVEGKVNPKDPDVISGTKTWTEKNTETSKTIYTVRYKLSRKPAPLMITGLKFYQPRYPSPNSWEEIDGSRNEYTIDGNQVKIVATVLNLSNAEKTATMNFHELEEKIALSDGAKTETFKPREEKEVELIWDTNGFAWKQSSPYNTAINSRDIEVSIPDDKMNEQISVHPKPVVIVPGMWSKREKLENFVKSFKNQNVPWSATIARVYVGKKAADNAPILDKTVRDIQEKENAWHVDMVAHSTGGLTARSYINSEMPMQFDNFPTVKNLVMLGTPNLGTPCAAGVDNIITKFFNRNPEAFSEISSRNMQAFNNIVTNTHGTKFLAVVTDTISPICQLEENGDGVVPFISAAYKSQSYVTTNVPHEDLGGDPTVFTQIKKWIALSPKESATAANLPPANPDSRNENTANLREENVGGFKSYGAMFMTAGYSKPRITENMGADDEEPNFAAGVKLAAGQSTEIEVPVTNGSRLSLILYTSPNVSATLIDDKGEIVGKNLAGTPEAAEIFRTITVKKAFQNGKWKLKLESRDASETESAITVFIDYKSNFYSKKQIKNPG